MANAPRDQNHLPTALWVSSVDNITPIPLKVNPVTWRLLIDIVWGWDVVWPASSVDNRIATFDWVTGKLIQDSWELLSWLVHTTGAENVDWAKDFTTTIKWVDQIEWFIQNWQIVTSVSTWNLTVALKTLAWTDPSATDPVYVRIDNVIRTISSALSVWAPAGQNLFNAWSTELATNEIDYFFYLSWNTIAGNVLMWTSRIPDWNIISDFNIATIWDEKFLNRNAAWATTDKVVNIWRFNATLSAGAGYTWSIPATSIIINRPIYETRWLTYAPQLNWTSGSWATSTVTYSKYKIQGSNLILNMRSIVASKWTAAWSISVTFPFSTVATSSIISWFICAIATNPATASKGAPTNNINNAFFTSSSQSALLDWTLVAVNDEISLAFNLEI